jgi:hypothetical protein
MITVFFWVDLVDGQQPSLHITLFYKSGGEVDSNPRILNISGPYK